MSYASIVEMTNSAALQLRIAACAADEGYADDAQLWARNNIWKVVTADDEWTAAWDYARAGANPQNFNPDTGARSDVINDSMIKGSVSRVLNPPEAEPTVEE